MIIWLAIWFSAAIFTPLLARVRKRNVGRWLVSSLVGSWVAFFWLLLSTGSVNRRPSAATQEKTRAEIRARRENADRLARMCDSIVNRVHIKYPDFPEGESLSLRRAYFVALAQQRRGEELRTAAEPDDAAAALDAAPATAGAFIAALEQIQQVERCLLPEWERAANAWPLASLDDSNSGRRG